MFRKRFLSIVLPGLLGYAVFCPDTLVAQHHGGHTMGGGIPGATNRPTGVDEKDDLKDFHRALAVQATTQQVADFQALIKEIDEAKAKLETFAEEQPERVAGVRPTVTLSQIDQFLQGTLIDTRKFTEAFSPAQKSGLKDSLKKLSKCDSDLQAEEKRLDDAVQAESRTTEVESTAQSVVKSLIAFSDQQLALGREMGIVLAEGSDVVFNLPEIKTPIKTGDLLFDVTANGELSQVAAQGVDRAFKIQIVVDISELRENLTDFLRPQLSGGRTCGERIQLRQATMTLSDPASTINLDLHYERWSCVGAISQEVAESDGMVEVKLRPVVDNSNSLNLESAFARIDAGGLMAESLRSGPLGEELRDHLNRSMLPILRGATDLKKMLPPAIRQLGQIQNAKFREVEIGKIAIELNGQMRITDQQATLMASQLNQALFAKDAASQGNPPAKER